MIKVQFHPREYNNTYVLLKSSITPEIIDRMVKELPEKQYRHLKQVLEGYNIDLKLDYGISREEK